MIYNKLLHELGDWQNALHYEALPVSSRLVTLIQSHVLLTGESQSLSDKPWYILPDNSAHLIFYLFKKGNAFSSELRLIGPRTKHKIISRKGRYLTFLTSFKPGGLSLILDKKIQELVDNSVNATEVFELEANVLEQLFNAAIVGDKDRLRERMEFLLYHKMMISERNTPPIMLEFLQHKHAGIYRVSEIADKIGVTERHLRTVVKEAIGHSPKLVLQIQRFSHLLELSNKTQDWCSMAYDSGYYDQSHMIADFQRMVEVSPEKLFAL